MSFQKELPEYYKGSKMFMPTGERLFWLGEVRQSVSGATICQDFKDIRTKCLAEGRLFEDPEFPATDRSLYSKKKLMDKPLKWLRPGEICKSPKMLVKGYSRFDVQQGSLANCWFAAALSNLGLRRDVFFQVVPDDQSFDENYAGIFHFRFWQYGRWVDIVIDDRLPTNEGKPVFIHSSEPNEFWSALLEKAYAKLHGSYEALENGLPSEALEIFTGGITEVFEINNLPPDFYGTLLRAYKANSLLACTTKYSEAVKNPKAPKKNNNANIIQGHSYTVTRVTYLDTPGGKISLLRLRNPWGKGEWKGAWSDISPEWKNIPESKREELGLTFDNDGEFWMTFEDLLKNFDNTIEICICQETWTKSIKGGSAKYVLSVFEGKWVKGISAGGSSGYIATFWMNPQYTVTLDEPNAATKNKCIIIVSLNQKNRRYRGKEYLKIGFAIYRLPKEGHVPKPLNSNFLSSNACVGSSKFTNFGAVSASFNLEPGTYVIVPSTSDPNIEDTFLLRVLCKKGAYMAENDKEIEKGNIDDKVKGLVLNPEPTYPALECFNRLAGPHGLVGFKEIKEILNVFITEKEKTAMLYGHSYHSPAKSCLELLMELLKAVFSLILSVFCIQLPQKETVVHHGHSHHIPEKSCLELLLDFLFALFLPILSLFGIQVPQKGLKGEVFSMDVCKNLVDIYDKDKSGGLRFEEFRSVWIYLTQMKAVFGMFVADGRGTIPPYQLRDALTCAGYSVNARGLHVLLSRYGSCDGCIYFNDFIMCTTRIEMMIKNNETLEQLEMNP